MILVQNQIHKDLDVIDLHVSVFRGCRNVIAQGLGLALGVFPQAGPGLEVKHPLH